MGSFQEMYTLGTYGLTTETPVLNFSFLIGQKPLEASIIFQELVKKYRGGGRSREGVNHEVFEPCARGGSYNFQLPSGGASPYFII